MRDVVCISGEARPPEAEERQEIRLPQVGADRVALLRWLVGPGDLVESGETLLCVDLNGQEAEIVTGFAGRLLEIFPEPNEIITSGALLAIIDVSASTSDGHPDNEGPVAEADLEIADVAPDAVLAEVHEAIDDSRPTASVPSSQVPPQSGFEGPRLPRPVQLDKSAEQLSGLTENPRSANRIEAARAIFGNIASEWNRFSVDADRFAEGVDAAAVKAIAAAEKACARGLESIERDLEATVADAEARLAEFQQQFDAGAGESLAKLRRVWNRIGHGLDLEAPELTLARRREGDARDPTHIPQDSSVLEAQAAQLPQVPVASQDPFLSSYAGGAGFVAFIFGFAIFQNFFVALVVGVLTGGGVLGMRRSTRAGYASLYDALVTAVVQDEFAFADRLGAQGGELQEFVDSERASAEQERAAARDRASAVRAAVAAESRSALEAAAAVAAESAADVQALIDTIHGSIRESIDSAPDLLAAWDAAAELPSRKDVALEERAGLRIGETIGEALRPCRLLADPPALPDAGPKFWRLGSNRSLLFSNDDRSSKQNASILTPVLLRALHQLPPGKVQLTLFDPLGLGRNFGPFLELGEGPTQLIGGRVWSNTDHLRQRLRELIEHIERVTQKYLQAKYADIESYSAANSDVPEPYRFLVVEDFPECFDEDTVRDLARILQNGPRCGVYVAMHRNRKSPLPRGVDFETLRPFFLNIAATAAEGVYEAVDGEAPVPGSVVPDGVPDDDRAAGIVRKFAEGAAGALVVNVEYQRMLEKAEKEAIWGDRSGDGISVPLGPAGRKVQTLSLGRRDLAHHALLVGRPGSGKSNLLHVFITTAARLYSPWELQFYLIDFKQGVEFKPYADSQLPHAHVIALQSEREFGLSVLQGLEAEMTRRGDLFAAKGVQNIADYRMAMEAEEKKDPGKILPRIVLVVDEFQQFFARDDRIKRESAIAIGRLVSQARYSGIHLIFGTQSLATATLERAIRDQITVRIALQCSEADSRLILAEDNTAARMLTRPGEAIYNSDAGLKDGNTLFQVANFTEADRDRELQAIRSKAADEAWTGKPPRVFAGHEPGDLQACQAIAHPKQPETLPKELVLWLGESTSLKPLSAPPLKRQPGRNLAVLTREEVEGVGVLMAALLSLAVQCPPGQAQFKILDLTSADSDWADHPEEFADAVPHRVDVLGRHHAREAFADIAAEVRRRVAEEERRRVQQEERRSADAARKTAAAAAHRSPPAKPLREPPLFLVLLGIQRLRDLRAESPAPSRRFSMVESQAPIDSGSALLEILKDGPEAGVHTLIWCDTYANLERAVSRDGLEEIGIKMAGPLSDQESRRLFDDEVAAGIDKPHRMVLGDDDRVGVVEMVRPFRLPTYELIGAVGAALCQPAADDPAVAE